MNIYSFPPLLCSLIALLLGAFVYSRNRHSIVNISFSLLCLTTFWWQFSWFILFNTQNEIIAHYLVKIGYSGIIFIPITFFHFVIYFFNLDKIKKNRWFVYFAYFVGFIFVILLWKTDLLIKGYYKYFWGYYPKASVVLHPIYLAFLTFLAFQGLSILFKLMRKFKKSPYEFNKMKYLFIGFLCYTFSASDFIVNYGVEFYPLGFVPVTLSLAILTYVIIHYRLMGINLFIRRYVTIYLLYAFAVTLVFLPFAFFFGKYLWLSIGIIFLVVLVTPYFYRLFLKLFEPFVDKVILGGKYLYWKKLEPEEFLKISAYTSLELAEKVSLALYNLLNLEGVSFFVYKKEKKQFRPLYSLGIYEELIGEEPIPWIKYSSDHPFIKHLSKENRIISQENNPFKSYLDKIPFEIILPLFVYKSLKGFILLSSKKGKELFHPQDLERLERLKTTLETHLSHSLFMEERALYSYKLAHDMKNIVEKSILPLLEKTIKMPSQQNLGKLLFQVQFLKDVLRDNFDMGRIYRAIIYKDYPCTPFSYKDIVFAVKDSLENFALSKNLYLKLEIPSKVPPCLGNPKDIYKLLYNLVLNGLKFTQNGGVKITVKVENDEILTEVKDTGCGIPSDRLDDIFTPFFQIKDEEKQEGVGLGLTIVRDIIEANNGKIWVESELNKGTTFYFTLPQAK